MPNALAELQAHSLSANHRQDIALLTGHIRNTLSFLITAADKAGVKEISDALKQKLDELKSIAPRLCCAIF